MTAQEIIALLNLELLPHEGGFFHQTYISTEKISQTALPQRFIKDMPYGTAIYFLLTATDFSAMHRLRSDEIYHFYYGDPVEMLLLRPDGSGEVFLLGSDLRAGMRPQKVVKRGVWQGSRLAPDGQHGLALLGTTMAPGFDWDSFELGEKNVLLEQYPDYAAKIIQRVR